ncbi:MAG: DNA gyrase subunit A [Myxococcota bacterium]|jgi:DNA gyrase subunit A
MPSVQTVPLHLATSERYLTYAMSVITSRALPDVRDGLKPVHRRILYTMYRELGLRPDGRYRKSAAVVGEVMGKYHPHGDNAIYDSLVRMAQPFSLLHPLVDGQGNFGSLDGDPPAAMRYTECRLQPIAQELLTELGKRTVDFRPTYDGQRFEPIVLPAQFPHLLVNGSEGIAVGMATRIPPHNLGEVVDAAIALIDDPTLDVHGLLQYVRGPDFPTGGRLLADPAAIRNVYETGQGTWRLRATWVAEQDGRKRLVVITSVPYGQNKAKIVEQIGELVRLKKVPQIVDVRDESTDDVRVVLELKTGASAETAMAFLYKHTPLQGTWSVNLTALAPKPGHTDIATPARMNLHEILRYWLDFRFETVRRRYEFDLKQLLERIHILEGFARLFDDLDAAIQLIRSSEGRRDAHEKLIDHFELSDLQAEAILELKLYKLAKLEIQLILDELGEKRAEAERIQAILASDLELWGRVRAELTELRSLYAQPRRTLIGHPERALTYDEDAYIVKEDTWVVVTRDAWVKRQSSFTDMAKIRVREDDAIGWLINCHTRSTLTFFGSAGSAYVMRVDDVPATTGYGEPLQRHFQFSDGERLIGVVSHDDRHALALQPEVTTDPPPPHGVALTTGGRVIRFPLASHTDPSTKSGRRYARLNAGDAVFLVEVSDGSENVCLATTGGRALSFPIADVSVLKAAGKGVAAIRLRPGDEVMAFALSRSAGDGPMVTTSFGRELVVHPRGFTGPRGGKGKVVLKRGTIDTWARAAVVLADGEEEG